MEDRQPKVSVPTNAQVDQGQPGRQTVPAGQSDNAAKRQHVARPMTRSVTSQSQLRLSRSAESYGQSKPRSLPDDGCTLRSGQQLRAPTPPPELLAFRQARADRLEEQLAQSRRIGLEDCMDDQSRSRERDHDRSTCHTAADMSIGSDTRVVAGRAVMGTRDAAGPVVRSGLRSGLTGQGMAAQPRHASKKQCKHQPSQAGSLSVDALFGAQSDAQQTSIALGDTEVTPGKRPEVSGRRGSERGGEDRRPVNPIAWNPFSLTTRHGYPGREYAKTGTPLEDVRQRAAEQQPGPLVFAGRDPETSQAVPGRQSGHLAAQPMSQLPGLLLDEMLSNRATGQQPSKRRFQSSDREEIIESVSQVGQSRRRPSPGPVHTVPGSQNTTEDRVQQWLREEQRLVRPGQEELAAPVDPAVHGYLPPTRTEWPPRGQFQVAQANPVEPEQIPDLARNPYGQSSYRPCSRDKTPERSRVEVPPCWSQRTVGPDKIGPHLGDGWEQRMAHHPAEQGIRVTGGGATPTTLSAPRRRRGDPSVASSRISMTSAQVRNLLAQGLAAQDASHAVERRRTEERFHQVLIQQQQQAEERFQWLGKEWSNKLGHVHDAAAHRRAQWKSGCDEPLMRPTSGLDESRVGEQFVRTVPPTIAHPTSGLQSPIGNRSDIGGPPGPGLHDAWPETSDTERGGLRHRYYDSAPHGAQSQALASSSAAKQPLAPPGADGQAVVNIAAAATQVGPIGPAVGIIPSPISVPTATGVTLVPSPVVTSVSTPAPTAAPPVSFLGKPKKLKEYTGKDGSWETYQTHLNIVKNANQWDDVTTLWNFCAELSGVALEFYGTLSLEERDSYPLVISSMGQRFGTMVNLEAVRSRLEALQQKTGQSLASLGQQVRNLAYAVYADDTIERREKEAIRCFMHAITATDVRQALVNACPIATFSQAIDLAVKASELGKAYMTRKPAPMRLAQAVTETEPEENEGSVLDQAEGWEAMRRELEETVQAMWNGPGSGASRGGYKQNATSKPPTTCYFCNSPGHWAKDCFFKPHNWPDWLRDAIQDKARGKPGATQPPAMIQPQPQAAQPQPSAHVCRCSSETVGQSASAGPTVNPSPSGQKQAGDASAQKKKNKWKKKQNKAQQAAQAASGSDLGVSGQKAESGTRTPSSAQTSDQGNE